MSCCSGGYCQFNFPEGPPLVDNAVSNLDATYQFLPYGTLLKAGETVRIWMQNGKAKPVLLEEKIELVITDDGPQVVGENHQQDLPWQLIALDSGFSYEDLMDWKNHPLYSPDEPAVVLRFNHPIEVKPTLKMMMLKWLYKFRNL